MDLEADSLQPQMDWGQDAPVLDANVVDPGALPPLTDEQKAAQEAEFAKINPYAAPVIAPVNGGNVGPVGTAGIDGANYATGSLPYDRILGAEGGINKDGSFRRSPKGAWGPAQLMPDTLAYAAKLAGVTPQQAASDKDANIAAGKAYYDSLRRKFNNDAMAAAAYNAGPGNPHLRPGDLGYGRGVYGAMARASAAGTPALWFNFLPAETQNYVHKVIGSGGPAAPGRQAQRPARAANNDGNWGNDPVVVFDDGSNWGNDPVAPEVPKSTWQTLKDYGSSAVAGYYGAKAAIARTAGSAISILGPGAVQSTISQAEAAGYKAPNLTPQQIQQGANQVRDKFYRRGAVAAAAEQAAMPENPTLGERVVHGAVSMVPAFGAAAINPIAGAAIFGQQGYDEAYEAVYAASKKRGMSDAAASAVAQNAGLENAAISAGASFIPGEKTFAGIWGSVAKKYGINVTSRIATAVGRAAGRMTGNAGVVGAMGVGSNVVESSNGVPNTPFYKGVGENMLEGALAGELVHGATRTPGAFVRGARAGVEAIRARGGGGEAAGESGGANGPYTGPMPGTGAAQDYAGETWGHNDPIYHAADEAGFAVDDSGNSMRFGSVREAASYLVKNKLAGQFEPALHPDGSVGIRLHKAEAARSDTPPLLLPDGTRGASEEVQAHADEAGVETTPQTPHDQAVADIVEKEAETGEPTHEQANNHEQQVDSLLDPVDEEALNAHIAAGATGEHGTGVGAFPVSGHGDVFAGTPQAAGERAEGAAGGGEAAQGVGRNLVPSLTPTKSGKGIIVSGASAEQLADIKQLIPDASGSPRPDGSVVFSARHAADIRRVIYSGAALDWDSTDRADRKGLLAAANQRLPGDWSIVSGTRFDDLPAATQDALARVFAEREPTSPPPIISPVLHAATAFSEYTQPDMFGGRPRTESELAALENYDSVIDAARDEDPRLNLPRLLEEIDEAHDAMAEDNGRNRSTADIRDYTDAQIPESIAWAIRQNPSFLSIMREKVAQPGALTGENAGLLRELTGLGEGRLDAVVQALGMARHTGEGDEALAYRAMRHHPREIIRKAMAHAVEKVKPSAWGTDNKNLAPFDRGRADYAAKLGRTPPSDLDPQMKDEWLKGYDHANREAINAQPGGRVSATGMTRDQIINRLASLLGHTRGSFHERLADDILNRDFWSLRGFMAPHNKKSRQVFTEATGIKLPSTKQGTEDRLAEWAGVSKADIEATKKAHSDELAAKHEARERKAIEDAAADINVRDGDRRLDGKTWVDEKIAEGFTALIDRNAGKGVPRYALINPKTRRGYPIKGDLMRYARIATIEADNAREAADENAATSEQLDHLFGKDRTDETTSGKQARSIGTNPDGLALYEDENGVRSYVRNGVRVEEPVGLVPTREGGYAPSLDVSRRPDEFKTEAEREPAAEQPGSIEDAAKAHEEAEAEAGNAFGGKTKESSWGDSNKGVKRERAEEIRRLLKERMGRMSSGIDPETLLLGAELAAFHIEAGARRFADFVAAMIEDLGMSYDHLRPYLRHWYNGARDELIDRDLPTGGMDTPEIMAEHLKKLDALEKPVDKSHISPEEANNAGPSIHAPGTGPLEVLASEDVPRTGEVGGVEPPRPDGEQESGGKSGVVDAAGSDPTRGGGIGPAGPDQSAAGAGSAGPDQPGVRPAQGEGGPQTPGEKVVEANEAIEHAPLPNVPASDFSITDDVNLGQGTEGVKYQDNVDAIKILKQLEVENRRASPAEQRALARYVGWGGLKNAFRVAGAKGEEGIAKGWEKRVAELEELLTPDELRAARNSTTAAHYTSKTVVDAMWQAVQRLGFREGAVLEPSMGTGNFIGLMPKELRGASRVLGVEYDSLTARIAAKLYPKADVIHSGFQSIPLPSDQFALAIGNPPFGRESLYFPHNTTINGKSIHNQFFLQSLESVAPGGIMAMVVSHNLMDALDPSSREMMAERGAFIGGVRLPDIAFKENARTSVVTDMLFFRKRPESDRAAAEAAIRVFRGADYPKGKDAPSRWDIDRIVRDMSRWVDSRTIDDPAGSGERINANPYFLDNPAMVVGRINATGTMNQRADLNVTLDDPKQYQALIDRAVGMLPQGQPVPSIGEKTLQHYEAMAEAMRLSAERAEPGRVTLDLDGRLKMVVDIDGPSGKPLMREVPLVPGTPFPTDYSYTMDGKWQRTVDVKGADGKPLKVEKDGRATNRNQKRVITYDRLSDIPAKDRWGAERVQVMRDLLPLRDAMKRQIILESSGATDLQISNGRAELNRIYKDFVDKHGSPNAPKTAQIADVMPDGGLALAAENKSGNRYVKSEIMSKRVNTPPVVAERAEDVNDAIAISLSESGRIDIERIAGLLGMDVTGAEKALSEGEEPRAFYDPEEKLWVARDQYLSGLVRRKLLAARAEGLDVNARELEAVIPEDWPSEQIKPMLGSNWIPPDIYADFLKHLGYTDGRVTYSEVTNAFSVGVEGKPHSQWETSEAAHEVSTIVARLLNSQGLKVVRIDHEGKRHVDEVGTAESEQKGEELSNEFLDWAYTDDGRRERLTRLFNDKFNGRLIRQRDGSHLKLYGKVPDSVIKMRRHQMNGIWRGITDRAVLYDHVVGAGKTFTAIARIMERRRMGLSQKPLVVVPNHLVEQWAADATKLYPGAKVLAAGKADFERANRRRLFARIAASDFDMAIVGHSSFNFIDLDRATEERYILDELNAAYAAVKEAEKACAELGITGGRGKPFGVAEAERLVKKLETRLERLRAGSRDRLLSFEQMGIDDLTIDEQHEFKNLSYSSRLQDIRGMGNKTGSAKAMDLHLKIRAIRERHNTSVAFLTGTPISNSVAEMYLLLRNLVPDEMRDLGIENFDAWRSMFVSYGTEWEPTEAGGVKEVSRLGRNWTNMRALMDLYYSVADAVTNQDIAAAYAEDNGGAKYPIPDTNSKRAGGGDREIVTVPPSPTTVRMLNEVVAGFEALPGIKDAKERNIARLKLMDRARKVSLDPRAVDPHIDVSNERGKLAVIANRVAQIYRKWDADKGTQIIFLDRSVPKSKGDEKIVAEYDAAQAKLREAIAKGDADAEGKALDKLEKFNASEIESLRAALAGGWNAYDEIKKLLIAQGIPAHEIRFVQEANTDSQKAALFDQVNKGEVRVLIGSTPRMGAGTNVQERLVALHHGDVTWKPSDIEQREGRIVRQGNSLLQKYGDENFAVDVIAYATERSVDAKMWDLNATKLKGINGIRKYDGSFDMEFEDAESASMAETAALATGDPLMVERVVLDGQIKKLSLQQRSYNNRINAIRSRIASNKRQIKAGPQRAQMYEAFAGTLERAQEAVQQSSAMRTVTVEGQPFDSREAAMDAAQAAIAKIRGSDEKARFSIVINGEKVTTQDGVQSAIRGSLGTPNFEGTVGGQRFIDTNEMAKALADIAARHNTDSYTLDGILIDGLPAEIDVAQSAFGKNKSISISILDPEGREVAHYSTISDALSAPTARSLIQRIREQLDPLSYKAAASREVRASQSAAELLPGLQEEIAKPWPKADELQEKRARLQEVISALANKKGDDRVGESREDYGEKPATLKQFGNWVAHIDVRGRRTGTSAANRSSIASQGFTQSNNVNALPPWMGPRPDGHMDVTERDYLPRAGDVVYLAPPGSYVDGPNGPYIKRGWRPGRGQVVTVEHDGQSLYDLYRKTFDVETPIVSEPGGAGGEPPVPGVGGQEEGGKPQSSGAIVRGLGIAEQFARHGAAELVGQFVTHPNELAEMAQIYRNPRHETLRMFFMRGPVVAHATGVSSRAAHYAPLLPGGDAEAFRQWIRDTMESSGADGFYMLHNHPSGDPTPSPADEKITRVTATEVPGFRGHVVINSNRFAVIDAHGNSVVRDLPGSADVLLKPAIPHEVLGQKVANPDELARVSKMVQRAGDQYVTIIVAGPRGDVRAVVDFPRVGLDRSPKYLMAALRRNMRAAGGSAAFLVGSKADIGHRVVLDAIASRVLTEAIDDQGRFSSSEHSLPYRDRLDPIIEGGPANFVGERRSEYDRAKTRVSGIVTKILGRGVDETGRWLADKAEKVLPDPVHEVIDAIGMGINPMGEGSDRAQASVKDFANATRLVAHQWGKVDEWLKANFNEEQRRRMWEAADEHGVILRRGEQPGAGEGLNRLAPNERAAVIDLQRRADAAFARAVELGMVSGEGLESYVPRMIVEMTAQGPRVISKTTRRQEQRGGKLSTTTGQLRQRKYETVEETEAAARAAFGARVEVVRDIRTLALATQRLEQAIAGKTMVQKIKAMSRDAGGGELVQEGGNPNPDAYFTIDNPALKKWGPRMTVDPDTGRVRPLLDENGEMVMEATPIWISREFEGPLKAVLRAPNGPIMSAAMALKAKMMGVIMYSPMMHNAVIWGKALPADPVGMLKLFEPYRLGNAFRKDPALMAQAIKAGMVPIGARYFMQDIAGIAAGDGLDMAPGRSWTAQGLALIPGLFSKDAGNAVKRAIDRFGDFWHNTLLWDRIADLQAGLYVHIRDGFIANGLDQETAQRAAAHYANRYAGALPIEALSKGATNAANLVLFSRSFTLGNLGAFKDLIAGLPSDVRAQVERDAGAIGLEQAQGLTRRKAIGMFIFELALQHLGLVAAAAAFAWLMDEVYQSPSDNEEGHKNRFLIRYQNDGTAIYGRVPTGKVSEDWSDWVTDPRETFLRKQSPYSRCAYQIASGDAGFGHKLYDPEDSLRGREHSIANIVAGCVGGVLPGTQYEAISALAKGTATDRGAAWMQALLPVVGITVSHGAPGGPAIGDLYRYRDEQQYQLEHARPEITQKIKAGDLAGARAQMTEIGVAPGLQNYIIRSTNNPQQRMSARQVRDFMQGATPEQRQQFIQDRDAQMERRSAP